MKTQAIDFKSFMKGDWKEQQKQDFKTFVKYGAGSIILIVPKSVFAASVNGTFGDIHESIMQIFDAGVVLVIIFAGAAWSLGHRSKAIEILIGVCCGYLLARRAVDIRDFLKGIGD